MASFLALKTHLEPMMFAPSGASSSLYVPAAFKVANSSLMAFSVTGQLARGQENHWGHGVRVFDPQDW